MCGWWLIHISYLSHYLVSQTMTEDCGKFVVTHMCSKGILYVANSMQYLLLSIILFMLNNMYEYMTQNVMLWISTEIFFCSCYV